MSINCLISASNIIIKVSLIFTAWSGVIWIGARKEHGEWSWDNGDSLGNKNWAISRPQNLGSCVVMHTNFKWIDLPCSSYTNFVCER